MACLRPIPDDFPDEDEEEVELVTALAVTDEGIRSIPLIVPLIGRAALTLATVQRSERDAALAAEAASPAMAARDVARIFGNENVKLVTRVDQACLNDMR